MDGFAEVMAILGVDEDFSGTRKWCSQFVIASYCAGAPYNKILVFIGLAIGFIRKIDPGLGSKG